MRGWLGDYRRADRHHTTNRLKGELGTEHLCPATIDAAAAFSLLTLSAKVSLGGCLANGNKYLQANAYIGGDHVRR